MLDLSALSEEQQQALLRTFEVAADNPLEMLKMDFLSAALDFKEWIEKNATVNKTDMQMMWDGLEARVNAAFKQSQLEISKKTGIPLLQ